MESRILEACSETLAAQIAPRAQILDAASPGPQRLDLLLERSGPESGRARLAVDLAPARACLYLARPAPLATGDDSFLRSLVGRWIVGVDRPAPGTPLLRLSLAAAGGREAPLWLVLEWLGGRPDAVLVDAASREVIATLGRAEGVHAVRRSRGNAYRWPDPPHRPPYERASAEQIEAIFLREAGKDPVRALARGLAGLPACLAYEAVLRAGSDPSIVSAALREIAAAPFEPVLYTRVDPGTGLPTAIVSPIPLISLEPCRSGYPGGLFRLLEHAHETVLRAEEADQVLAAFLRRIAAEERRLLRLHDRLAAEAHESARAPQLRRMAEALLVHLQEVPRGAGSFSCSDPADPLATLEISLDPRLGAPANADLLFRRARRLTRGDALRAKRLAAAIDAAARLSILRERARSDPRSITQKGGTWLKEALGPFFRRQTAQEWERERAGLPALEGPSRARPRGAAARIEARSRTPRSRRVTLEERFHPRVYKTREGWTVLVGRSNEENDYVTHALARPDDYWFHAHGCPGSHVVLRREGRKDNPSARTIEEVAAIAAYYSKARTSRKALVLYTLKKYARKPRGGAPGLAVVTRERTIMVEPKAPPAADTIDWDE